MSGERQTLNRQELPPIVGFGNLSLPEIRRIRTESGINLNILFSDAADAVRLIFLWKTGVRNMENLEAATLMPMLLEDGTASRSGEEISSALDFSGASLSAWAGPLSTKVVFTAVTDRFSSLLDLVADVILNPVFPESAVRAKSASARTNIEVSRQKLSTIAYINSLVPLWGKDSPAARIVNLEHLSEITPEELASAHRQIIEGSAPDVWLVGNVRDRIVEDVSEMLSEFRTAECGETHAPVVISPDSNGVEITVDVPDKDQSYIQAVLPVIGENDDDFYPLSVAVTALGGYFGSRLMRNIREEKGLTYGVSCNISVDPRKSYMTIGCQTTSGNETAVISEIRSEIARLSQEPPCGKELAAVVSSIESELASRLDSVFAVAGLLTYNNEYGIGDDSFDKMLRAAESATSESIADMAAKYLKPDKLIISVARGSAAVTGSPE